MNKPELHSVGIVDVEFGQNVKVIQPVNLYGCRIADDCFIGPFVEIQRDAVIGRSCRIQSHAFICGLVTLGENCFISHGVKFVNDLFQSGRPSREASDWKQTTLGSNVSVGTNATILPVSICDDVIIGAGAVVTKDIGKPGIYAGNPARFIRSLE